MATATSKSETLTRLGKRVERTGEPRGERRERPSGPLASGLSPRLRAIAWHRMQLRALAALQDPEAQDAAGSYHMQQLARYLREEARDVPGGDA